MSSLPSNKQLIVLALLPKISGGMSAIFSIIISYQILFMKKADVSSSSFLILRQRRRFHHQTNNKRRYYDSFYHRIILGISLVGILTGFALFLSTWPIPSSSSDDDDNSYQIMWGASGNETTCRIQGFFIQLSVAMPLYYLSLSFYYLLTIKYSWKESQLTTKKYELLYFHGIPLGFAFGTSIACLPLDLYHPALLWCWIASGGQPEDKVVNKYRMIFYYGPVWISMIIVCINLIFVFAHVRKITLKAERHTRRSITAQSSPSLLAATSTKDNDDDRDDNTESSTRVSLNKSNNNIINEAAVEKVVLVKDDVANDELYQNQGFSSSSSSSSSAASKNNSNSQKTIKNDDDDDDRNDGDEIDDNNCDEEKATASSRVPSSSSSSDDDIQSQQQQQQYQQQQQQRTIILTQLSFVERRKEVALQSLRFAITFIITWLPISIIRIIQMIPNTKPVPYWLLVWASFQSPLFLPVFMVYCYPYARDRGWFCCCQKKRRRR